MDKAQMEADEMEAEQDDGQETNKDLLLENEEEK